VWARDVRRFTLITLIVLLILIGLMTWARFGGRAKPSPSSSSIAPSPTASG
jgi:hypothetical protein